MNMYRKYHDMQVSFQETLETKGLITRPGAGPGLWLLILLPCVVMFSKQSQVFSLFAFHQLIIALHLVCHIVLHKEIKLPRFNWNSILTSVGMTWLYSRLPGVDFASAIPYVNINSATFMLLTPSLMQYFPKSFTFGEAGIVAQSTAMFSFTIFRGVSHDDDDFSTSIFILQIGLAAIYILCLTLYKIEKCRHPAIVYILLGLAIFGVTYFLQNKINTNPILWILEFTFQSKRLLILLTWISCCSLATVAVFKQIQSGVQAATDVRKTFHILASVVYITGVVYDPHLLFLASGIILAIFVILEIFRILGLPPLAEFLNNGFLVYADEKDSGGVALTPIYLLIGVSLPLWLLPTAVKTPSPEMILPLLSGVLTVGIGDTCASYVGKNYGHNVWPGSNKTVEGTVGCAAGQLVAVALLLIVGFVPLDWLLLAKAMVAIVITSLVEALTDQVDNIVLPLLMLVIFSV